jgi:hypothetical protein
MRPCRAHSQAMSPLPPTPMCCPHCGAKYIVVRRGLAFSARSGSGVPELLWTAFTPGRCFYHEVFSRRSPKPAATPDQVVRLVIFHVSPDCHEYCASISAVLPSIPRARTLSPGSPKPGRFFICRPMQPWDIPHACRKARNERTKNACAFRATQQPSGWRSAAELMSDIGAMLQSAR